MASQGLRASFFRFYHWLKEYVTPGLVYSQDLFERELESVVREETVWLDVGCGHQLLPPWRLSTERVLIGRSALVVGIDLDFPSLGNHRSISRTCMATASNLPFADGTFDLVTANMVVEHLDDPVTQFAEITRVLKPGGIFMFHTPNVYGYTTVGARLIPRRLKGRTIQFLEGREEADVFPAHYRANSESRIRQIASQVGLNISRFRLVCSSAQFVMLPPLLILELLWIRLLLTRLFRKLRTNIICCLRRPDR